MHNSDTDGLTDALLRWTTPQDDPASGRLPTADEVAALGERRLKETQELELVRIIQASAAGRDELRALYPDRYAEFFVDAAPPPAKVLRFPSPRAMRMATGITAAAAAAAIAFTPLSPPDDITLGITTSDTERGQRDSVAPRSAVHLNMRVPPISWRARLLGAHPWAALVHIKPSGHFATPCTAGACRASEHTLAYTWQAPRTEGTHLFVLVAGFGPPPSATVLAGATPASDQRSTFSALQRRAVEAGWSLAPRHLQVR